MSDRTPEQIEADLDDAAFARLDTAMRDAYGVLGDVREMVAAAQREDGTPA